MSYRQHEPKKVINSVEIRRVECEKTGTIYYENVQTKETAWIKSDITDKK
tara:strand:- start:1089 stop:1238 length:150 start_codon:yes stop_codon:yes gene_type:complete